MRIQTIGVGAGAWRRLETVGVLRYAGAISRDAMAQVRAAVSGSAWTPQGDAVSWFHDPPWTLPPLRRNEAAVPVAPSQPASPPARSRP